MAKFKVRLKVRLILYNSGNILLLKQTKPNGGNYTLVGGTIESGESAKGALIRESYEEAGIKLRESDLQLVHVLQKVNAKDQRLVLYFKAQQYEGKLRAKEKHKFKSVEWFSLYKLPDNLTDTVKHVLRQYRKGIQYSKF
jgi:ADP-ribose pyrophosphatase YjhB (NUDIX family)